MDIPSCPYLGVCRDDPIFQFELADGGFRQLPQFPFSVPDATNGFYLAPEFGFFVPDAHGLYLRRRHGALIDDQFNRGQAAASRLVFAVAHANQGVAVTAGEALGAGASGASFFSTTPPAARSRREGNAASGCFVSLAGTAFLPVP